MNIKKTKKYKHFLTDFKYFRLDSTMVWCNNVFYTELDRYFGCTGSRKIPYGLMINSNSSETHKVIDWLDSLDEEYHNLFGISGGKIYYNTDSRIPYNNDTCFKKRYQNGYDCYLKWIGFKKKFHKICREIKTKKDLRWYSDEERLVMNFYNQLFELFIDDNWFGKINESVKNLIDKEWYPLQWKDLKWYTPPKGMEHIKSERMNIPLEY